MTFLHFSPDGTLLASGDNGGTTRLWNWAKGGAPVKNFSDRTSLIRCFAFSHDGKSMATGNDTGIIRVWDVSSGKLIHTLMGQALDAALSARSSLLPLLLMDWDFLVAPLTRFATGTWPPARKSASSAGNLWGIRMW